MPAILTTGTAAGTSSEVVLADGASALLHILLPASTAVIPRGAQASVQLKDSNGNFLEIDRLDERNPVRSVQGPGTYRVERRAGAAGAFGVDRD